MSVTLFLAALALRGTFPQAGGRAHIVTGLAATAVEHFGSTGAALLFVGTGAVLSIIIVWLRPSF